MPRSLLIALLAVVALAAVPTVAAAASEGPAPVSPWPTRLSVVSAVQQASLAGRITVKVRTYAATRTLRAAAAAAEAVPGRYVTVTVTAFGRTGARKVAGTCRRATGEDGYLTCVVSAPRRVAGGRATSFLAQVAYETGEVTSSLYDSRTVSLVR